MPSAVRSSLSRDIIEWRRLMDAERGHPCGGCDGGHCYSPIPRFGHRRGRGMRRLAHDDPGSGAPVRYDTAGAALLRGEAAHRAAAPRRNAALPPQRLRAPGADPRRPAARLHARRDQGPARPAPTARRCTSPANNASPRSMRSSSRSAASRWRSPNCGKSTRHSTGSCSSRLKQADGAFSQASEPATCAHHGAHARSPAEKHGRDCAGAVALGA